MAEEQKDTATAAPEKLRYRVIKVGRRTYRKVSRRDRRRKLEYTHPELRLSNAWLKVAGFNPGDRVLVSEPRPGVLVLSVVRRATPTTAQAPAS